MISTQAQITIEKMVVRAINGSPLVTSAGVRSIDSDLEVAHLNTENAVVLTISSYVFRLVFLIHYTDNLQTRAYFAAANRVPAELLDDHAFVDSIRECGNICCGNLNRDLVSFFPHVGMSTPNIVSRRCIDHLAKLGAQYIRHFGLTDDRGPIFGVTVCVVAFEDLDFSGEFEEETTGELEMF